MALLEESGKTGVCFYYPIGGGRSAYLRSTPISTYQKVGVYFAVISAVILAFGIVLLALFPDSDNGFTSFAGLVVTYGVIRIVVLFPKMTISRSKIKKASPGPLYAVIDQCCYFSTLIVMELLFMRQLKPVLAYNVCIVILLFTVWAILPLVNSAILLNRQRANI